MSNEAALNCNVELYEIPLPISSPSDLTMLIAWILTSIHEHVLWLLSPIWRRHGWSGSMVVQIEMKMKTTNTLERRSAGFGFTS